MKRTSANNAGGLGLTMKTDRSIHIFVLQVWGKLEGQRSVAPAEDKPDTPELNAHEIHL